MSITGALSTLLADAGHLDAETERSLVENAHEEAGRLNQLVGNLLDMTRVRSIQTMDTVCLATTKKCLSQ